MTVDKSDACPTCGRKKDPQKGNDQADDQFENEHGQRELAAIMADHEFARQLGDCLSEVAAQ